VPSLWYLVQPLPLLVQGAKDTTVIDLAAQVDGRVATRSARRGTCAIGPVEWTCTTH
jgi:HlyD family secretion protein